MSKKPTPKSRLDYTLSSVDEFGVNSRLFGGRHQSSVRNALQTLHNIETLSRRRQDNRSCLKLVIAFYSVQPGNARVRAPGPVGVFDLDFACDDHPAWARVIVTVMAFELDYVFVVKTYGNGILRRPPS